MTFAELKSYVESAMGRTDVPAYVYVLTTAGINRDCRLLDMQTSTTVTTASNPATLPSDFGSIVSAYTQAGGDNFVLESVTDHAANYQEDDRIPRFYTIRDGSIFFSPEPDGTYTVYLQYIAKLSDLSADSDTNDVMTRYPDLYLYLALVHAAIWSGDQKREQSYGAAYAAALERAKQDDKQRRMSTGITARSRRL